MARLRGSRVLWLTVAGISYFWFLGSLLQLLMILFGTEVMGLSDRWTGILTTFAAIGIAIGSMAAGRLSGDKVELGLAPIGSIGMGVFAVLLSQSAHSFALAAVNLTHGRLLRRAVRGAAQRAAPAEERRRGKGPPDGDQQLPQHAGDHVRVRRAVAVPRRLRDDRRPDHPACSAC